MARATAPVPVPSLWLPCLFALLASRASTCRGERVHFRVHSGDIVDQHTHTRTVLVHPDSEALRHLRQLHATPQGAPQGVPLGVPQGVLQGAQANPLPFLHAPSIRAAPQQAVSFMRQTMQVPLQQRPGAGPGASGVPVPGGHIPSHGMGATHIQQAPITPIIPLMPLAAGGHHLSAPGTVVLAPPPPPPPAPPAIPAAAAAAPAGPPPRVTTKKTQTQIVTHQMTGPGPWPMHLLLPHGPNGELVPMRLVAVGVAPAHHGQAAAHPRPRPGKGSKSAALLAPPSAADLKKGKGCKAFIRPGEDPDVGDCFLEEYENGYNEERSKKTFFGGDNSSSKTEKDGARNTKRYKNESKFVHNPKVKHQWVRTPGGVHHLVRTEVGPLFTAQGQGRGQDHGLGQGAAGRPGRGRQRGAQRGADGKGRHKVTLVRLPPGATAVTTVLQGQKAPQDDVVSQDVSLDEDDDGLQQADDNQQREEDDGLVEVFKHATRGAPITAPLVAVSPAKPMWVQEYHPVRVKQVDQDEDEFEVEESAPLPMVVEAVASGLRPRPHLHPTQPRALDDMDLGWSEGFTDSVFDTDEADDKADMQTEVDDADFDHSMDDGDRDGEAQTQGHDGDHDHDHEQDHAASEIVNGLGLGDDGLSSSSPSHAMLSDTGPAERMLQQGGAKGRGQGPSPGGPRLSAILASGGHVFDPPTPPAPHPAAFGAKDPDRLEAGRKAPVVLEFGHELSGYKVTREREQKKWRRRR